LDCPSCRNECNCDICTRKRGEEYISFKVSSAQTAHNFPPKHTIPDGAQAPPAPVVDPAVLFDDTRTIKGTCMLRGSISDSVATELTTSSINTEDDQGHAVSRNIDVDEIPISRTFIGACQPSWRLGETPIIKELGGRRSNRVRGHETSTVTRWFIGKERLLHLPVIAFARNLHTPSPFNDLSSLSSLSSNFDVKAGLKSNDLPASKPTP